MATLASHLGNVHAAILGQHAELRARLRGIDACAMPTSSPLAAVHLRVSLLRLAVLFESHLRFEELELVPHIREIDAWGAAREAAMRAEHVEQRTRMENVCFLAESERTEQVDQALSREVSWLVVTLLDEMAREERELAELVRLGDEGPLEQMTG